jgi:hypothetical protein
VVYIANVGKRRMCRCKESMDIFIGKEKKVLFTRGEVYHCVVKDRNQLQVSYKIYGNEFDLSCTETEFQQHFVIINKKTGIKK